ncbi:MAG: hypothetical protein ABJB03_00475 [Rhodoglobus sp.]
MVASKKIPAHGTVARYRIELRNKTVCEKCRAANSRARKVARDRAKKAAGTGHLTLVPDTQSEHTPPAADTQSTDDAEPEPGPMETAVVEDLAEITAAEQVPFHRSLSALALVLAREADVAQSATARGGASRQLFEVLKSLRTRKEGDGNTALDIVLSDFGDPLVPPGPATVRHPAKPKQSDVR